MPLDARGDDHVDVLLDQDLALAGLFEVLANSQTWFQDSRPWIDPNFAQAPLFMFDGAVTGEQWANIGFTGVFWLVIHLAVGLRQILRTEVT